MSIAPANDEDRPDGDADRLADAMKDQLRKDVASWYAAQSDGSARKAAQSTMSAASQPAPQPARRAKRLKPASPEAKRTPGPSKPFSMSYDGVTQADYIEYMIARGAR
jgi:hypothetical protein